MEFKKVDPVRKETLESALEVAMQQIEKNKYDMDLKEAGIRKENIIKAVVAFKGKELLIKW
jgi:hemerythrin superfamily protein